MLTLLCGVSDEWAKDLPQVLAAARRTCDFSCVVFFQRYHNQRFFPAIEALIVIHRHGECPFDDAPVVIQKS